jgi:hypothetical protein
LIFGLVALVNISACVKDDLPIIVPISGKILDKETGKSIDSAKVYLNSNSYFQTDSTGSFDFKYNLDSYLADSVTMFVTRDNYQVFDTSVVVGNSQKDLYIIYLDSL